MRCYSRHDEPLLMLRALLLSDDMPYAMPLLPRHAKILRERAIR